MLASSCPHFLESWGQKCRRLRKGNRNHKVLDNDIQSFKSQAENNFLDQAHAKPHEEDEHAKGQESETLNNQKFEEAKEEPTEACVNTCGEPEYTHKNPWDSCGASQEAKIWTGEKAKTPEQVFANCSERNGTCPPVPASLKGTSALNIISENVSLDEDIQKWTANDVHDFISGLPGCSDYAQVFKDHAIDGETLPLLTEEHLRSTMGLKLGPALKILSQVSQHVETLSYKKSFSHPTHTKQVFDQTADTSPLLDFNAWGDTLNIAHPQNTVLTLKGTEQDKVRN